MMARYIRAAEAADKLSKHFNIPLVDLIDIMAEIPSADVAPVRHGRWLTWEEMFPGETPKKKNNLGVFCGVCKNHADNMSGFCPNCGARMDTKEEQSV